MKNNHNVARNMGKLPTTLDELANIMGISHDELKCCPEVDAVREAVTEYNRTFDTARFESNLRTILTRVAGVYTTAIEDLIQYAHAL